jgi:hypothetical protein
METLERSAPPAWHPDPGGSGALRWWDGQRWTEHVTAPTQPQRPVYQSTDGFAIAALILSLCGGTLLAIIFGFVARSRIKNSGGLRTGNGLATAGIVLGFTWIVVIAGIIVIGTTTSLFDESNAKDYHGEKRLIAAQVDRFEDAVDKRDGKSACTRILTARYAAVFDRVAGTCEHEFDTALKPGEHQVHIDVKSIDITGANATVRVDEGGRDETWRFIFESGDWRLDDIHG